MDLLAGAKLKKNSGEADVDADQALADKQIVCFYFSAHWCPPCRQFTPILKDFYDEVSDSGVEIIFVSSDRSAADMTSYMKESHGEWLAVEHDSDLGKALKTQFGISGIPALIVCKKDGTVVTKSGRQDVQGKGPGAVQEWNQ